MPVSKESRSAHNSIKWVANAQCSKVIDVFRMYPEGLTRSEVSALSGIRLQSVAGRCNDLLKVGVLTKKAKPFSAKQSEAYEKRATDSGRMAAVLILA